jgi:hypothetical protein
MLIAQKNHHPLLIYFSTENGDFRKISPILNLFVAINQMKDVQQHEMMWILGRLYNIINAQNPCYIRLTHFV